ncbi:hypothetical protein VaNZ11_002815 [Volvox africanus]|uniref:Uncharacterized protein n=1 Tax=Volvox africanus TaxID=51714 RepID=A0ABQ5RT22_9CHLO|nr:hypothetical protein VaNZ11_002815 [Volvox africanus]
MSMASGAIIQDALSNLWYELKTSFTDASGAKRAEGQDDVNADSLDTHYETLASEPYDLDFKFQMPASPAPSHSTGNAPPASWEFVKSMSGSDADLETPLVTKEDCRTTESSFTSVAVSIGSVLLGGALGATAAVTTTPFIATGIGASLLLASFIASAAMPNDKNERPAAASTTNSAGATPCQTVDAGSTEGGTAIANSSASTAVSVWPSFNRSWPRLAEHWDLSAAAAAAVAAVVAAAGDLSAPVPAPADLPLEAHPKVINRLTDGAAVDAWGEWWMV